MEHKKLNTFQAPASRRAFPVTACLLKFVFSYHSKHDFNGFLYLFNLFRLKTFLFHAPCRRRDGMSER